MFAIHGNLNVRLKDKLDGRFVHSFRNDLELAQIVHSIENLFRIFIVEIFSEKKNNEASGYSFYHFQKRLKNCFKNVL